MIIKKFTAKTENEAIEAAKKELGDGVVVMNVKNVKRKGFLAFLKAPLVEVTVALEEESEKYTAAVSAINSVIASSQNREAEQAKSAPAVAAEPAVKKESSAIEEKLDSLQLLLEQQLQKPEEDKEGKTEEEPKEETETDKFMKLLHQTMLDNEVDEQYANEIIEEIDQLNKPNLPFDYALANIYQKKSKKIASCLR